MSFVKFPNFVITGSNEEAVERLLCKSCGKTIASMQYATDDIHVNMDGSRTINQRARFVRHSDYVEVKMQMADGSFHISLGCSKCVTINLNVEQLTEIYQADMEEQRSQLGNAHTDKLLQRVPSKAVAIKLGGGMV